MHFLYGVPNLENSSVPGAATVLVLAILTLWTSSSLGWKTRCITNLQRRSLSGAYIYNQREAAFGEPHSQTDYIALTGNDVMCVCLSQEELRCNLE